MDLSFYLFCMGMNSVFHAIWRMWDEIQICHVCDCYSLGFLLCDVMKFDWYVLRFWENMLGPFSEGGDYRFLHNVCTCLQPCNVTSQKRES
jgi:hypothetical protein